MTNQELEDEITAIYLWWAENVPNVTPRIPRLMQLWAEFDRRVDDGRIGAY